jgi:cytoskeletal protein RodZ
MESDTNGLRDWRRNRGITLEAISASTKLSIRLLRAIESGDFRQLPGGIYDTNYIRQYARAIEFDEAALLAFYQEFCRTGSRDPRKSPALAELLFQH